MPSEEIVSRIERALSEVTLLGGSSENTGITPNLEIINNAPGKTGFILVSDSRDGDNIFAKKVPGVGYENGDLVNVLFIEGAEPIAFQQGSQSSGDPVLVSKLVSPDETINPVISADNSGDVTIAGTGDLIIPNSIIHSADPDTNITFTPDVITANVGGEVLLTLTEAAQDVVKIGDGGDVDINFNDDMFLEGSSGEFGIGTITPGALLDVSGTAEVAIFGDGTSSATISINGSAAQPRDINFQTGGVNRWIFRGADSTAESGSNAGSNLSVLARNDAGGNIATAFFIRRSDQQFGFGVANPAAKMDINQGNSTAAVPVIRASQLDIDEPFIMYRGNQTNATLARSIVRVADITTTTLIGYVRIEIDNTGAGSITDGDYFMPFYTLT